MIHVGFKGARRVMIKKSLRTDDFAIAQKRLLEFQRVADEAMRTEAERAERAIIERNVKDIWRAAGKKTSQSSPVFSEFCQRFIGQAVRNQRSAATVSRYTTHSRMFSEWIGSETRMNDVGVETVQDWYNDQIDRGNKPGTANNKLKTIRLIYSQAKRWSLVDSIPMDAVVKITGKVMPKKEFSLAEVGQIVDFLSRPDSECVEFREQWEIMVLFAAISGARQVDCKNAVWSNFSDDFLEYEFSQIKTGGDAWFPIPSWAALRFREFHERSDGEFLCPDLRTIRAGHNGLSSRFVKILELAGVENKVHHASGPKGNAQHEKGFHSFRSFFSTELDRDGVSEFTNQLLTGHEDRKEKRKYIRKNRDSIFSEVEGTLDRIGEVFCGE